ncbi:thiolase family protein [Achromobacter insuavis]
MRLALDDAGLRPADVDGLGLASFTLRPDRAIDMAWRLGLTLDWCMQDEMGGASAINLLRHAWLALRAGQARTIVLVAGDHFAGADFAALVGRYNRSAQDYLAAGLRRAESAVCHADAAADGAHRPAARGLWRAVRGAARLGRRQSQRRLPPAVDAGAIPGCADGGRAAGPARLRAGGQRRLRAGAAGAAARRARHVRASGARYNADQQEGDGLVTGIAGFAPALWADAGLGPQDMDVVGVYDDYPAMAVAQLCDLGLAPADDLAGFIARRIATRELPVNTAGGQLSAGQAGTAGGMHGLAEVARQLLGRAGARQVAVPAMAWRPAMAWCSCATACAPTPRCWPGRTHEFQRDGMRAVRAPGLSGTALVSGLRP